MTGTQIRQAYLHYFKSSPRNHAEIPPARLVPENDPTTLFTSSGMQQLVPYLKGEPHSMGTRLTDSQPSFRAEDIDEIGDNRHTTFFEMLGNWSLGDYFKQEQLPWIYEFITSVVGLDPTRLYVTVFAGNESVPRDDESIQIWQNLFHSSTPAKLGTEGFDSHIKIYMYDAKKNWWSRSGVPENMPMGEIGGPDSEMFFDFGADLHLHEQSAYKDQPCHVNCDCGRFMEIGNSVFMQYIKTETGFKPLPKQNVDFGGGLERIAAAANNNPDIFKIDLIYPIIQVLETITGKSYSDNHNCSQLRIVADHMRAATFLIAQGVLPANKLQGYFLRRLLRRSMVKMQQLTDRDYQLNEVIDVILSIFHDSYLSQVNRDEIVNIINDEKQRFSKTLTKGLKVVQQTNADQITGKFAFDLYQTFGFPLEITEELVKEKGITVDREAFRAEFKKHQDISRQGSQGLFKGGLADHSETIVKYHTTTHLLQAALRQVLGSHVQQMGSNITAERLRFDFKHFEKMTPQQLQEVEQIVNQKIKENLPVYKTIETKETALNSGAIAFFRDKYPDTVSVYTIGQSVDSGWFSKELCGGPHVSSTGEIGPVTIKKEEAVGAGVRRIYMTLQQK